MEKLVTYIKSGKGNGLLFLLATALIITIFWMFLFKQIYNDVKPQLLLAADSLLPITIENAQITAPVDTYKRIDIYFGEKEETNKIFPIILDTREEAENTDNMHLGLFIKKNGASFKIPPKTRIIPFNDGTWDKAAAEELLDYFSGTFSFILSIIMVTVLTIILAIKTFIAAIFEKFIISQTLKDDTLTLSTFMRLSAILISITDLIILGISLASGIRIGIFPQLLTVLLLAYVFFTQQKKAPLE